MREMMGKSSPGLGPELESVFLKVATEGVTDDVEDDREFWSERISTYKIECFEFSQKIFSKNHFTLLFLDSTGFSLASLGSGKNCWFGWILGDPMKIFEFESDGEWLITFWNILQSDITTTWIFCIFSPGFLQKWPAKVVMMLEVNLKMLVWGRRAQLGRWQEHSEIYN